MFLSNKYIEPTTVFTYCGGFEQGVKMVLSIGDLHLDDARPWGYKVSKDVVNWLIKMPENNSDNIGVFLGDLTESAFPSGRVYDLLFKLFRGLKFKKIVIVVGNHDFKNTRSGQLALVYEFLKNVEFKNIEIVDSPKASTLEGLSVLYLPYLPTNGEHTMKSYERLDSSLSDPTYDVIFGHFQDASLGLPGESINIEYLKTKHYCFGHIHNPSDRYIGSIIPNSIAEANKERRLIGYDNCKVPIEIPVPNFCDYYTVKFPDPLPKVDIPTPIYTILDCNDEAVAREHYGNIYIRKCLYDIKLDTEAFNSVIGDPNSDISHISTTELFSDWLNIADLSDTLKDLSKKYLVFNTN